VNLRGDIVHGRNQLGAQITASLQGRMKGSHLSLAIRHFSWLAANVALVETDCEITGIQGGLPSIASSAEGVLKTRMKYVAIKRDRRWYFTAGQNTPVLPPPPKR
jgi:uncharacterized protein (TIGR02246 family)